MSNTDSYPQQGYPPPQPGYEAPVYQQPAYGQPAYGQPPAYEPVYGQQQPGYPPQQPPYQQQPPQPPYQQQPPQYQQNQAYSPSGGGVDPDVPPTEFNYDPFNVNYQNISVNQFQSIPNEQTEYSMYWDSPAAFEPEAFEENTKKETKWNDLAFLIVFWIHFAVTVAVFAWVAASQTKEPSGNYDEGDIELDTLGKDLLWKSVGTGVACGVILNILHFCYMTFAPMVYIKLGFFIGIILSIILCLVPAVIFKAWGCLAFPVIWIIIALCVYCICKKRIPFSAAVLSQTCHLICRYPSILFVELVQCILDIGVSILFSAFIFYIQYRRMSNFLYIWVIFSYYWTSLTFGFVTYMTASGLASTWYFLNDTEYFPKNPCLQSLKRSLTTSFGSAALAGLLLAIIQTLKAIIYMDTSSGSGIIGVVICLLKCIALCVLRILECCISFITRYALIYCATFGVPFKEGCRRFVELQCNRFIDALMGGCIISYATGFNLLTFSVGAALLGYGLGYAMFDKDSIYGPIFTCIFCLLFTMAIFLVVMEPVETMTDTIFICFAEAPERLKTSANELYELFVDIYGKKISKLAEKGKGKEKKKKK